MKRPIVILTLSAGLALLTGCGGGENQPAVNHAAEAERTITTENMDRHMEALEAEIAADEAAFQE